MAGGGSWRPPRSCEDYWWEWKHCRGLRHAFHHYYTHGELPACGRWREDYEACRAWERGRAAAAQVPPGPACPCSLGSERLADTQRGGVGKPGGHLGWRKLCARVKELALWRNRNTLQCGSSGRAHHQTGTFHLTKTNQIRKTVLLFGQ
ncbi:synaptic plasticity regulator PANTS isoform X1 [Columba livia]|uniref:synaptic plasticity regulator PANTS isoform X1 n=1 Tax=Columba livia TaxID=8932 RepID=UPI0031BA98A1